MKKYSNSIILKTGLAIFAMLFGSANLIFPIKIGVISGNQTFIGLLGFMLSGILIPLTGLISMVFFDGNYKVFFHRIGKIPGNLLIFICMLTIGPLIAMPRIITFSYSALEPFWGQHLSLIKFSIIFGAITFFFAYKKNSVIDHIGKILSPLLLISLSGIFVIGYLSNKGTQTVNLTKLKTFYDSLLIGYNTLDLLGTIFFAYIAISILHNLNNKSPNYKINSIAKTMIYSSAIAGILLSLVYSALAYLGAWYGSEFKSLQEGEIFSKTILKIVGSQGALILGITVFLACLTTIIALASVVGEYIRNDVFNKKICYKSALILVLTLTVYLSQFSLGFLLYYSSPIINITYPILITLTFCNLSYKLWGFKPVKIPVLLALIISLYLYGPNLINTYKTKYSPIAITK